VLNYSDFDQGKDVWEENKEEIMFAFGLTNNIVLILPAAVKIEGIPDLVKKCNCHNKVTQLSVEIQKMFSNGQQYFNIIYFGETSKIERKKEEEFLLSILTLKAKKNLQD